MFEAHDSAAPASNGLGASDQAAGLRRWAEQQGLQRSHEPAEAGRAASSGLRHTLMVIGLPDPDDAQCARAWRTLQRWHVNGHRWIGHPDDWQITAVDTSDAQLAQQIASQSRWALWVDSDLDSFRRAYLNLRRLRDAGGPRRLLVLHPGISSCRGLLGNLQQAAASFLGVDLLLLSEQPPGGR
ncbi:hypothetical protein [Pseudomonas sp. NW5]|uniref:hypothetical protein n=1 Tax=Pseudomonas sp. NW5 TaxID=2934934 RepID=UPI0020214039|nr:hypothetical protein [Pseudomonas sp. NW5]MCL7461897.1 hypothetical protein [Pseudomonas sp. NW5]